MKRILLALLLCAACKHSTSSSSTEHTETQTTTESTSSETGNTTTTTVVETAPGETVTTISEYDPPAPEEVMPSESERGSVRAVPDGGVPATPGAVSRPSHGPLRKQTVIEDKHGATTAKTAQQAVTQAQGATETRATGKVDATAKAAESSAPSAGCIGTSWMIGLGILLLAVALILGILKFHRPI